MMGNDATSKATLILPVQQVLRIVYKNTYIWKEV